MRLYRDIDWAVLRSDALYLPFKGGDMAANHGNYDANSLLLWVHGARMLNDPGYGFKETADHNCLLVNGKGQSLNEEPFPWGTRPRSFGRHSNSVAKILKCGTIGGDSYLVCEAKTCYAGMLERYQRHAVLAEGGYVVVFDDVEAAEPSEFTVNWHTTSDAAMAAARSGAVHSRGRARCYVISLADRRATTAVVPAQYDRAFRIDSGGPLEDVAPVHGAGAGRVADGQRQLLARRAQRSASTGGTSRSSHNEDGSYRYAGGELTPAR